MIKPIRHQEVEDLSISFFYDYQKYWPDCCPLCGGWGTILDPDWIEEEGCYVDDRCECLKNLVCPRCGLDTLHLLKDDEDSDPKCTNCNWCYNCGDPRFDDITFIGSYLTWDTPE